jgi:DNA topoisomerase-2
MATRNIHNYTDYRHIARSDIRIQQKHDCFTGLSSVARQRHHHFSSAASASEDPKTMNTTETSQSVESMYSRKSPIEHILLRPSMYIGPTERSKKPKAYSLSKATLDTFRNAAAAGHSPTKKQASTSSLPHCPDLRMTQVATETVPALSKVFDEILVNASDNRLRHGSRTKNPTTRIDVTIDPGCATKGKSRPPFIKVWNNGRGVPIQMHAKEQMYIPQLVFGHLLTGSNFDDTSKRLTGGRHGFGAKLTNIFSHQFQVETTDLKRQLTYKQTWTHNMSQSSDPEITSIDPNNKDPTTLEDSTCVSFTPDLTKLTGGSEGGSSEVLHPDDFAFMCRRVADIAGCTHGQLDITLNGIPLNTNHDNVQQGFEAYCKLYLSSRKKNVPQPLLYTKVNARWEVGVALSPTGSFECVSFVNGMYTSRGGTHVSLVVNQLIKKIATKLEKVKSLPDIKSIPSTYIKRHLFVFCNALVENPTFDSQMKDTLTSNATTFGSDCPLSKKFLSDLVAAESSEISDSGGGGIGIVEQIARSIQGAQHASLLKEVSATATGRLARKKLVAIDKLDDAHWAGSSSDNGKKSSKCTLILTEGDSAKALAVAGLEVIGRETYGVFPLRGKFLNVRVASLSKIAANQEVKHLCQILGLDFEKTYESLEERSTLRYGNVMLMTDQDTDGSHIKGLMINFFRHFWPALLLPPVDGDDGNKASSKDHPHSFLSFFRTPLLKATKKSGPKKTRTASFFSAQEYDEWNLALSDVERKQYTTKYYKGLGTSTSAEAKEYFQDFPKHYRRFVWRSEQLDGERVDMLFEKDRAADRRAWILERFHITAAEDGAAAANAASSSELVKGDVSGKHSNENNEGVTYAEFVDQEMIHFANGDNIRSIPNLMDGLKPSQRKVLFSCFKRKLYANTKEIKVAQLAGYCAEHTAYHHGEQSLHSTIVGMAQDFCGSNNVPLLQPLGQFGTRFQGGKDAASPRYIFTKLSPVARLIFPEVDDALLTYREDDGQVIEPTYYCPVVPLVLVNGSQGIGTGWSTFIPPGSLTSVIGYVRHKLKNDAAGSTKKRTTIKPHVTGFTGTITPKADGSGSFVTRGIIERTSRTMVTITELPVGRWINDHKLKLIKMQTNGKILGFVEKHTSDKVCFVISLRSAKLDRLEKSGYESLLKEFDLETTLSTTNMHLFDPHMEMTKFDDAADIANVYFDVRHDLYHKRKAFLTSAAEFDASVSKNKSQFIDQVSAGEFDLLKTRQKKVDAELMLEELGFDKMGRMVETRKENQASATSMNQDRADADADGEGEHEHGEVAAASSSGEYDYLLNMPLSSFTSERIAKLDANVTKRQHDLSVLQKSTADDLWRTDLDQLEEYNKKNNKK